MKIHEKQLQQKCMNTKILTLGWGCDCVFVSTQDVLQAGNNSNTVIVMLFVQKHSKREITLSEPGENKIVENASNVHVSDLHELYILEYLKTSEETDDTQFYTCVFTCIMAIQLLDPMALTALLNSSF